MAAEHVSEERRGVTTRQGPARLVRLHLVRFALRIARSQVQDGALTRRSKRAMEQLLDLQRPDQAGEARVVLEDGSPRVAAAHDRFKRALVRDE
eukprot:scaffold61542_cov63-Phaeocystis_antarctica.AAC.5